MPFANAEVRRAYMRRYMRDRYALDKAFKERVAMRAERHRMRIALNRLEKAKAKAAIGQLPLDSPLLNLAYHWNAVEAEGLGLKR